MTGSEQNARLHETATLDHDTVAALHSQARREFLDSYSSDASTVMQWLEPHLKKAREDALPHRYMRPDPEDDA